MSEKNLDIANKQSQKREIFIEFLKNIKMKYSYVYIELDIESYQATNLVQSLKLILIDNNTGKQVKLIIILLI